MQFFTKTFENQLDMKISVLLTTIVTARKNGGWQQKEWEVQDTYFAGEEVVLLSMPFSRSTVTGKLELARRLRPTLELSLVQKTKSL